MEIKCLVYSAAEVSVMLNVSLPTAYRKIREINQKAISKGFKDCVTSGKVSKKLFHEVYPNCD